MPPGDKIPGNNSGSKGNLALPPCPYCGFSRIIAGVVVVIYYCFGKKNASRENDKQKSRGIF
jgi:hypothetical protein